MIPSQANLKDRVLLKSPEIQSKKNLSDDKEELNNIVYHRQSNLMYFTKNFKEDDEEFEVCRKIINKEEKIKKEERIHKCDLCLKTYLSYPALYTHKRNKHNIIPITNKQSIFQNNHQLTVKQFNYISNEKNENFAPCCKYLKFLLFEEIENLYTEKSSIFNRDKFYVEKFSSSKLIQQIENCMKEKLVEIPKEKQGIVIDKVFAIYLIYFTETTLGTYVNEVSIKFILILREFLNSVGWDIMIDKFQESSLKYRYDVNNNILIDEKMLFTENFPVDDLPELMDDFLNYFITLDRDNFGIQLSYFTDLISNLCNWLFTNEFTDFKLSNCES